LEAALNAQARKATLRVNVEVVGVGRLAPEVEAAVYFCCLEALQNVQKHANASTAGVRLWKDDGFLNFEVFDDGQGFDLAHARRGAGFTNIEDRLDALGGTMKLTSETGRGARLFGTLSLAVGAPAGRPASTAAP
jgi:signal transduction histidine kinase